MFDSSGSVLFAHGFDKPRNGKYQVREFEQKFAEKMNANYALAVSSGSAAVKIALSALDVGAGDDYHTLVYVYCHSRGSWCNPGGCGYKSNFNLDQLM